MRAYSPPICSTIISISTASSGKCLTDFALSDSQALYSRQQCPVFCIQSIYISQYITNANCARFRLIQWPLCLPQHKIIILPSGNQSIAEEKNQTRKSTGQRPLHTYVLVCVCFSSNCLVIDVFPFRCVLFLFLLLYILRFFCCTLQRWSRSVLPKLTLDRSF